jgi:hypothetical protein
MISHRSRWRSPQEAAAFRNIEEIDDEVAPTRCMEGFIDWINTFSRTRSGLQEGRRLTA